MFNKSLYFLEASSLYLYYVINSQIEKCFKLRATRDKVQKNRRTAFLRYNFEMNMKK